MFFCNFNTSRLNTQEFSYNFKNYFGSDGEDCRTEFQILLNNHTKRPVKPYDGNRLTKGYTYVLTSGYFAYKIDSILATYFRRMVNPPVIRQKLKPSLKDYLKLKEMLLRFQLETDMEPYHVPGNTKYRILKCNKTTDPLLLIVK